MKIARSLKIISDVNIAFEDIYANLLCKELFIQNLLWVEPLRLEFWAWVLFQQIHQLHLQPCRSPSFLNPSTMCLMTCANLIGSVIILIAASMKVAPLKAWVSLLIMSATAFEADLQSLTTLRNTLAISAIASTYTK